MQLLTACGDNSTTCWSNMQKLLMWCEWWFSQIYTWMWSCAFALLTDLVIWGGGKAELQRRQKTQRRQSPSNPSRQRKVEVFQIKPCDSGFTPIVTCVPYFTQRSLLLPVTHQPRGQLHRRHQSGASRASPPPQSRKAREPQPWPARVWRWIRWRRPAAGHRTLQSALLFWR